MPRFERGYLDQDVLTAAKERIIRIIDMHDHVFVCFSGGKDSLATLKLTEMVYEERGIDKPVGVIFRDEELIPDDVINFVQDYYRSGNYNFRYFAVPLLSHKYILGATHSYIQWDPNREWIRDKPDFAITDNKGMVFDQYTMDDFAVRDLRGKCAFITGMRADESLFRYQGVMSRKNLNYISQQTKKVSLCKPLYDWSQKDIFKFFYDFNIKYCSIYDAQLFNHMPLRVSTPLHAESAKNFDKIKTLYPVFYQQLIDIFPEMRLQELYYKEYKQSSGENVLDRYDHTWDGIISYIKDNITDPHEKKLAITRVIAAKRTRDNRLSRGEGQHNLGGFPIRYVFSKIVSGGYKRNIMATAKASPEDLEYESGNTNW